MCTESATHKHTRQFTAVCEILKKHNNDKTKLIPILQEAQDVYRYLPPTILSFIASTLRIPASRVYGAATFYRHFALKPKGKYVVRVCDGTACHVKGSEHLADALQSHLKVTEKENTTSDMLFTLETVSCLGACGLAPAMVVNDRVFGQLSPAHACAIIDDFKKGEVCHA